MADGTGIVSPETAQDARTRIGAYKQALAYLNSCGELTLEKYREAHRLTGAGMSEWQVRGLWEASIEAFIATRDTDYARTNLRQTLEKAIAVFEKVAAAGAPPTARTTVDDVSVPAEEERPDPTTKIAFPCPHCSRRVTAPRAAAGKTGKCPGCGQKCRVPADGTAPVRSPGQARTTQAGSREPPGPGVPVGDLPLVGGAAGGYKNRLINTNDPGERLRLGLSFCDIVARGGSREAAEAVLKALSCDDRSEVSIGLACALAHLTGPYAKAVRELVLEFYSTIGDSTFFGGMPLLRLAYVAGLQRDLALLNEMILMRDEDNGVNLVKEVARYVEDGKAFGVYRVMAWGEGLDGAFNTAILEALPEHLPGKSALLAGLTEAVAYIKRHGDYH